MSERERLSKSDDSRPVGARQPHIVTEVGLRFELPGGKVFELHPGEPAKLIKAPQLKPTRP